MPTSWFQTTALSGLLAVLAWLYGAVLLERPFGFKLARERATAIELADEWLQQAQRNALLQTSTVHLHAGLVPGQETVAIHQPSGAAFLFPEDGVVYTFNASAPAHSAEGGLQRLQHIGGRVLGSAVADDGTIYACDVSRGLIRLKPLKRVDLAADPYSIAVMSAASHSDGKPILYCNSVAIDSDSGDVYFSDAMDAQPWRRRDGGYTTMQLSKVDFLRGGRGTGRLLRYSPATGRTTTLVSDIYFANGVALSAAGDFVVVAETFNARLLRHWVRGAKAGLTEVFALLPGFVDGVSRGSDGGFWASIPMRADTLLLSYAAKLPWLRTLVSCLPYALWPGGPAFGMVVKVTPRGDIAYTLQDWNGEHVHFVTAITEYDGVLYLGQLYGDSVPAVPVA